MTFVRDQRIEVRLRGQTFQVRVRAVQSDRVWFSSPESGRYPFPLPLGAEVVARPIDAAPYTIARLPGGRRRSADGTAAFVAPVVPVHEVRGRLVDVRVDGDAEIAVALKASTPVRDRREEGRRPHWEAVRVAPAAARAWTDGQLIEVSETGGRVRLARPWADLAAGQVVVMTMPGGPPLSLRAQITWCRRRQAPSREVLLGLRWMPGTERVVRRLLAAFR